MYKFARTLSRRGQSALEYLLLLAAVSAVVFTAMGPGKFLFNFQNSSQAYFNNVTSAVVGANPRPVDGGWCAWSLAVNGFQYRTCECPAPAFGGALCQGSDTIVPTPPSCPDGTCDASKGEDCRSCPDDCGTCGFCGDANCNASIGEDCSTCQPDCGACCPNTVCDHGETCSTCPNDCGICCGNGAPDFGEECDEGAQNGTPCVPAYASTCTYCSATCTLISVQGAYCGDGQITSPEDCDVSAGSQADCVPPAGGSCQYCGADCKWHTKTTGCGDSTCDRTSGEDCASCETDCGVCDCDNPNRQCDPHSQYCGTDCRCQPPSYWYGDGHTCSFCGTEDQECDPNRTMGTRGGCEPLTCRCMLGWAPTGDSQCTMCHTASQECDPQVDVYCGQFCECPAGSSFDGTTCSFCGDGSCQTIYGENCATCADCPCSSGYCNTATATCCSYESTCRGNVQTQVDSCTGDVISTMDCATLGAPFDGTCSDGQCCTVSPYCNTTTGDIQEWSSCFGFTDEVIEDCSIGCSGASCRNCGNGVPDAGEDCDNGSANSDTPSCGSYLCSQCSTGCYFLCQPYTDVCGSDGNVHRQDTCGYTETASVENCAGAGCTDGACNAVCGDGERTGAEECDNGAGNSDTPNCGSYLCAQCSTSCTQLCKLKEHICAADGDLYAEDTCGYRSTVPVINCEDEGPGGCDATTDSCCQLWTQCDATGTILVKHNSCTGEEIIVSDCSEVGDGHCSIGYGGCCSIPPEAIPTCDGVPTGQNLIYTDNCSFSVPQPCPIVADGRGYCFFDTSDQAHCLEPASAVCSGTTLLLRYSDGNGAAISCASCSGGVGSDCTPETAHYCSSDCIQNRPLDCALGPC